MEPRQLTDRVGTELGSPYWCMRLGALRCIDRRGGDLITLGGRRGAGVSRHATGATTASLVRPRADNGVIVVTDRQLAISSRDDLADLQLWGTLLADSRQRFVDGGCSPTGRLYVGTVGFGRSPGIAMVFRIDAGEAGGRPVAAGLTAVGGIAWSPDRATCYVNDDETTLAYEYRPNIGIFEEREVFRSSLGPGDGLTVDADGYLWVSHTGAGAIERVSPTGEVDAVVRLPGVTATTFGGAGLRTLYCTAGGAIWALEPGVAGQHVLPFRGQPPRQYT